MSEKSPSYDFNDVLDGGPIDLDSLKNHVRNQTLAQVKKIIDKWIERPSHTSEAKAVDDVLILLKEEIKNLKEVGKK